MVKKKKGKKKNKADVTVPDFTKEYKELKTMLGSETTDLQSDKASEALLRAFLGTLLDLFPILEGETIDNPNQANVYSLIALITQMREVSNDIRSVNDLAQQARYINDNIMAQAFKLLVQNISNELFAMRNEVSIILEGSPKKKKRVIAAVEKSIRRQGSYMQEVGLKVENDIRTYLVG